MVEWIMAPLGFDFMVNALIISALIALPCALLSCFLVLKGWALMGDAMSHAVFPGVVIAWMLGLPFASGAFVAGMLCALATGYLKDNSRIRHDTAMGIVFSGMFGFGLVLYVWLQPDVHLDHILFGDMLGIGFADIRDTALVTLLTVGIIAAIWRDLLLHAFDPVQAQAVGLHTRLLHYGLLALLALTIVASLKAVGIILAIAILIAPGAIAFLLTRTFGAMLLVSVAVAMVASLSGVWLSFYLDSAPAPTIVLVFSLLFVLAMLANRRQSALPSSA
ncbi:metal ABC transporter permease [Atlantibacter hermannii]|mgnify:CR=1 FL=1|uniref:Zinc ABC transporter permease protein n=1 Tax=Atlantibacter hermannii NBRC 105704 TaxID=1115512 RepID=H5V0U4_ATLHE|nr:metal ABC transporter permease [Atlantibacter hermannii]MCQ4968319.1 metal ABC transporter permease [Enterobacteriaceae bacterium DFI.7.85]MDU1953798.1 metal ABC transporter permease [Atlantibacter hermannii]MDU7814952.1 metal ABC transporter permease [Atlantibacter hermannii]MDW4577776.1 metal ABC transporter permease [Atlantibacter hermannii]MEB7926065.1 metal ABC transporter permease [Atlantibacter hermannii]